MTTMQSVDDWAEEWLTELLTWRPPNAVTSAAAAPAHTEIEEFCDNSALGNSTSNTHQAYVAPTQTMTDVACDGLAAFVLEPADSAAEASASSPTDILPMAEASEACALNAEPPLKRHQAGSDWSGSPQWVKLMSMLAADKKKVFEHGFRVPFNIAVFGSDAVSDYCKTSIRNLIRGDRAVCYKLGLSRDPNFRFHNLSFGYWQEGCTCLVVLHKLSNVSLSRRLERDCIAEFSSDRRCRNIAPGGEGIAAFSSRGADLALYIVFGGKPVVLQDRQALRYRVLP